MQRIVSLLEEGKTIEEIKWRLVLCRHLITKKQSHRKAMAVICKKLQRTQ